ncbi:hypothetical protein CLV37_11940, partial [Kineococcus rhizosphaerae]
MADTAAQTSPAALDDAHEQRSGGPAAERQPQTPSRTPRPTPGVRSGSRRPLKPAASRPDGAATSTQAASSEAPDATVALSAVRGGSEPEVTEAAESSDDFAQEMEGVPAEPVDQVQRIDLTALEGVREAAQGEHSPSDHLAGPASAQAMALANRLRVRRHSAATASLATTDVERTDEPTEVAASPEKSAPRKVPARTPGVTAFAPAAATGSAVDGEITTEPDDATDTASEPQEASSAAAASVVAPDVVAAGADLAESQLTPDPSEAPAAVSAEDQGRVPSSASARVYVFDAAAGSASLTSTKGAAAAQADNGEGGDDVEVEEDVQAGDVQAGDVQAGEYVNLAAVMDGVDVVDLRVQQGTELDAMKYTPNDSAEHSPETTHEAPSAPQSLRPSTPVRGADAEASSPAGVEGPKRGARHGEDTTELALPSDVDLDRRFQNWQAGELDGAVDLELPTARPTGGWRKAVLSLSDCFRCAVRAAPAWSTGAASSACRQSQPWRPP